MILILGNGSVLNFAAGMAHVRLAGFRSTCSSTSVEADFPLLTKARQVTRRAEVGGSLEGSLLGIANDMYVSRYGRVLASAETCSLAKQRRASQPREARHSAQTQSRWPVCCLRVPDLPPVSLLHAGEPRG